MTDDKNIHMTDPPPTPRRDGDVWTEELLAERGLLEWRDGEPWYQLCQMTGHHRYIASNTELRAVHGSCDNCAPTHKDGVDREVKAFVSHAPPLTSAQIAKLRQLIPPLGTHRVAQDDGDGGDGR